MAFKKDKIMTNTTFVLEIKQLLRQAQANVVRQVNTVMVQTYFTIGKRIVEQEQLGKNNAKYGTYVIEILSNSLTSEFGKGFSKRNLELIRKFYLAYRNAKSPISQSLSWTHFLHLMRIENIDERQFYEIETINNNWSVRELSRQIDAALYQRLAISKNKKKVKELSVKGQVVESVTDAIKY